MNSKILKNSLIIIPIVCMTFVLSIPVFKCLDTITTTQTGIHTLNPNQEIVYDYIEQKTFGIDVSKYQGNIDWAKVKQSGVE